jgi:predicted neutral ceramidase superfamily lipid hydrolase
LKDPELLSDARRANLEVDPVSAEEVQKLIARVYAAPRELTQKIKKAIQLN